MRRNHWDEFYGLNYNALKACNKKMKRLILPLIASITLTNTIKAEISDELHKKCLEARDYAGCVNTNKSHLSKKIKKFQGLESGFSLKVIMLN